tara:strand:+ start:30 stop:146 length:117 start_codon:yes stop_codon:yes gene_type:complete
MVGALDIEDSLDVEESLELHGEIDLQDEDLLIRFFFCC